MRPSLRRSGTPRWAWSTVSFKQCTQEAVCHLGRKRPLRRARPCVPYPTRDLGAPLGVNYDVATTHHPGRGSALRQSPGRVPG